MARAPSNCSRNSVEVPVAAGAAGYLVGEGGPTGEHVGGNILAARAGEPAAGAQRVVLSGQSVDPILGFGRWDALADPVLSGAECIDDLDRSGVGPGRIEVGHDLTGHHVVGQRSSATCAV